MSRNRYVGDYRIVESIDARGRVKSDSEYIGAPWVYAEDARTVKSARARVAACCAVGWLAWVSALMPLSAAMRALYVALPFAFAALPLALATGTALSLLRQSPPFERRYADRLENRAPACTFFVALLSGIALAGEGVNALRGARLLAGDGVFAGCAALLAACAVLCHRQWRRLRCVKAP